jgi:hypothetical protein
VVPVVLLAAGCADEVEQRWEGRSPLPSCGTVELDQGETLRRDAPGELSCFREAFASAEGAELQVTYPTVEGDPITAYYRVTPQGTTEVYEDGTRDEFGDGSWWYGSCEAPENALDSAC